MFCGHSTCAKCQFGFLSQKGHQKSGTFFDDLFACFLFVCLTFQHDMCFEHKVQDFLDLGRNFMGFCWVVSPILNSFESRLTSNHGKCFKNPLTNSDLEVVEMILKQPGCFLKWW